MQTNKRYEHHDCKYCGKELVKKEGRPKHFCDNSHKSMYYSKLRIERFNRLNPEIFIKKELEGEVIPKKINNYLNEIGINRVVAGSGSFGFNTRNYLLRKLGLKKGDVIKIVIKVVYREP